MSQKPNDECNEERQVVSKMTLNVNVIESREHLSSIDLLLAPSLVPARNGYRVTGELSWITDLPNGFLEKS